MVHHQHQMVKHNLPEKKMYVNNLIISIDASDGKQSTYSFFSIEYYQQFFNVDTEMVRERIVSSIIPKRAPATYLKQNIGTNPDLYGPFWIVVTLVSVYSFKRLELIGFSLYT